ncbi:MAG TPA: aspartyl protease family protein [Candidatus Acidoferrales bacterium]|nr:aspartyl protease family protein [Candidatus Acidoferrales bacterium]
MVDLTEPFHICEYFDDGEHASRPLIDISVGPLDSKRDIRALVDTGCTSALVIPKPLLRRCKLNLGKARKVTRGQTTIQLANGHDVNADIYLTFCRIGEVERKIKILVIDTKDSYPAKKPNLTAYLGLDFLNTFDVVFKGKEKRILFCHLNE